MESDDLKIGEKIKSLVGDKLYQDILDALHFAVYLIDASTQAGKKRHREEFYRVIILYIAAVVEAACLCLVKIKKIQPTKLELRKIEPIFGWSKKRKNHQYIVAVREEIKLPLAKLNFDRAIKILKEHKILPDELTSKLIKLKDMRNTQHLYNRRKRSVNTKDVGLASDVFMEILEELNKTLL